MNQIPSEGEFCGECPCFQLAWCKLYRRWVYADVIEIQIEYERDPICIQERPQIITRSMTGRGGVK